MSSRATEKSRGRGRGVFREQTSLSSGSFTSCTARRSKPLAPSHATENKTTIERISHDGRGIAVINNKITFLSGGLPGETVQFEYLRRRGSFDEGRVVDVLNPNPMRRAPPCRHFEMCGGCSLQHMDTSYQLELKQNALLEFFHREGIEAFELAAPLLSQPLGYRRRARLSVKFLAKKNKVLVGFREKNSRFVTPLERCEILHPNIGHLLNAFSELFYGCETRDQIPQMEVAVTDTETAIIIRHLSPLPDHDLKKIREFCDEHHLKLYRQPGGLDSIALDWPQDANPWMTDYLQPYDITLRFMPHQFIQINADMNQKMMTQALSWLDVNTNDRLLDLFCGIGNFTLPVAKQCASVIGVEGDAAAVQQATLNASLNAIHNATFFCDDLSQSDYRSPWAKQTFDKIILDPPRVGAKAVMPWIPKWNAAQMIYISCNPATLARDAKQLIDGGYTLVKAGIMDMFPHTQHVEAMAHFVKK